MKKWMSCEWNSKGINSCKPTYSEPTYSVMNCSQKLNRKIYFSTWDPEDIEDCQEKEEN